MTALQQPFHQIVHPTKSDHSKLHDEPLFFKSSHFGVWFR